MSASWSSGQRGSPADDEGGSDDDDNDDWDDDIEDGPTPSAPPKLTQAHIDDLSDDDEGDLSAPPKKTTAVSVEKGPSPGKQAQRKGLTFISPDQMSTFLGKTAVAAPSKPSKDHEVEKSEDNKKPATGPQGSRIPMPTNPATSPYDGVAARTEEKDKQKEPAKEGKEERGPSGPLSPTTAGNLVAPVALYPASADDARVDDILDRAERDLAPPGNVAQTLRTLSSSAGQEVETVRRLEKVLSDGAKDLSRSEAESKLLEQRVAKLKLDVAEIDSGRRARRLVTLDPAPDRLRPFCDASVMLLVALLSVLVLLLAWSRFDEISRRRANADFERL